MDLLDRFIDTVSRNGYKISKKTDEVLEMTEIKMDIKSLEYEIEDHKLYIGNLVYKYYTENEANLPSAEIKRRCIEIKKLERKLSIMKQRVVKKKGLGYCKNCGEIVKKDENYCPKCGYKVLKY